MLAAGFARVRKTARLAGAVRTHSPAQWPTAHSGGQRSVSYILGIETSCDDTAVAVVDSTGNVLSNVVSSQWELNAKWKGIVPALAARAHEENLPHVLEAAIQQRYGTDRFEFFHSLLNRLTNGSVHGSF